MILSDNGGDEYVVLDGINKYISKSRSLMGFVVGMTTLPCLLGLEALTQFTQFFITKMISYMIYSLLY